jgi:hypothetical protein
LCLKVRILDTPGLADPRGIQQDDIHKKSIATEIEKHIDSVNAVIILANGTVPGITVSTEYTLSTLSNILPKSIAGSIAFLFTNSSPLSWNFPTDSIPDVLKETPYFLLDDPLVLWKKYEKMKSDKASEKLLLSLRNAVLAGEKTSLETLVDLFDWLDSLKPQPTKDIISLYDRSERIEQKITDTLAQMEQADVKEKEAKDLIADIQSGEVVSRVLFR